MFVCTHIEIKIHELPGEFHAYAQEVSDKFYWGTNLHLGPFSKMEEMEWKKAGGGFQQGWAEWGGKTRCGKGVDARDSHWSTCQTGFPVWSPDSPARTVLAVIYSSKPNTPLCLSKTRYSWQIISAILFRVTLEREGSCRNPNVSSSSRPVAVSLSSDALLHGLLIHKPKSNWRRPVSFQI